VKRRNGGIQPWTGGLAANLLFQWNFWGLLPVLAAVGEPGASIPTFFAAWRTKLSPKGDSFCFSISTLIKPWGFGVDSGVWHVGKANEAGDERQQTVMPGDDCF
jgi:hypothetical protein